MHYLLLLVWLERPQPLHSKIEEIEAVNQSQFDDLPFQIIKILLCEYAQQNQSVLVADNLTA